MIKGKTVQKKKFLVLHLPWVMTTISARDIDKTEAQIKGVSDLTCMCVR